MAEEQQREKFPNLVETNDLVTHIGALTVDLLNRSKIVDDLWENIDVLLNKEAKIGVLLTEKDGEIERLTKQLEDQQAKLDGNAQKQNEKRLEFESELSRIQADVNDKDATIDSLEKEVQAVEARAVIDQESFRAVAQGEVKVLEKKVKDLQTKLDKAKTPPPKPKKQVKRKTMNG
tara:strand:+ start:9913 stop:10440 length:528 start_codon:yes stop_codon:yes gene_type:complete